MQAPVKPSCVAQEYISIIMHWPMSRAKALMHEFHNKGMAIKYGRSFSLSLDYFNAWRDQHDGSISRFNRPLHSIKGGRS